MFSPCLKIMYKKRKTIASSYENSLFFISLSLSLSLSLSHTHTQNLSSHHKPLNWRWYSFLSPPHLKIDKNTKNDRVVNTLSSFQFVFLKQATYNTHNTTIGRCGQSRHVSDVAENVSRRTLDQHVRGESEGRQRRRGRDERKEIGGSYFGT